MQFFMYFYGGLWLYANKGTNKPAHLYRLIQSFVFHIKVNIIIDMSKVSTFLLVTVDYQAVISINSLHAVFFSGFFVVC